MVRVRWTSSEPKRGRKRRWRRLKPVPAWRRELQEVWLTANLTYALSLLALCAALTVGLQWIGHYEWADLWPELGGMSFDIFFILIVFAFFEHRRARSVEIERQRETIDDYKRWDAPEARLRIAGAIRRLNRKGITALNLSGAKLSDFRFAEMGIPSLVGSSFYDGSWGDPHHVGDVTLSRVEFSHVDCSDVCFSPYDPFEALSLAFSHASFTDCTFTNATLTGARFNGAELAWSEAPPESLYDYEEGEDGQSYSIPTGYGPFHDVSLEGVAFRAVKFKNADFRGATDIEKADFFRATGLEDALFYGDDKQAALASASRPEDSKSRP